MAVYKIYPTKDSTIYSEYPSMNTGLDQILEASTYVKNAAGQTSRYLLKFSQTENANGEIPLKFTYDVMTNPNDEDVKSNDFRNYIGDILVECIEDQLKNGKLQIDE